MSCLYFDFVVKKKMHLPTSKYHIKEFYVNQVLYLSCSTALYPTPYALKRPIPIITCFPHDMRRISSVLWNFMWTWSPW